jgi:hypothetical protein
MVVARPIDASRVQLLGEMKGWAYNAEKGLQLDTMRVIPSRSVGVGDLIWAATMAWALENTPCRQARLLAIRDDERNIDASSVISNNAASTPCGRWKLRCGICRSG